MKNLLLLPLLLATALLSAQTEKGRFMLGVHNFSPVLGQPYLLAPTSAFGIGFGKSTSKIGAQSTETKYLNLGLSASGHYFIVDNLSLGLVFQFFTQTAKWENDQEFNYNVGMASPEVRYYLPVADKMKGLVRASGGFGSSKSDSFVGQGSDRTNLAQFSGGVGLAIFPSRNFSMNIGANYAVLTAKDDDSNGDDKDTDSGLTIDLGFSLFFGGGAGG